MYFWEDEEMSPKQRIMRTGYDLDPSTGLTGPGTFLPVPQPQANLARSMAAPAPDPAPAPYTPPPVQYTNTGFHDEYDNPTSPAWMAPGYGQGPGAGYGSVHAGDRMFGSGPSVSRQWTEADLEPLSVGSFGGFNFSKPARPYMQESPNLPLFRADMAQRSQAMNFAAEMANSQRRMDFQGMENEADRMLRRELAGDANMLKKDQALAFLADPNIPPALKEIKSREAVETGKLTPQQAGSLKLAQLLADAGKAGLKPESLEFWKYLSGNYDPSTMSNLDLIAQLQKMNVPASVLAQIADPVTNNSNLGGAIQTIRQWMGAANAPDEVRARQFARSLLAR